jgi:hypothetical protein
MSSKGPSDSAGRYAIAFDESRGLVRVTVIGVVDANLAPTMVAEARAAAMDRGFNILYDFLQATPGNVGTGDVFWYPRKIPVLAGQEARRVRIAVLHRPEVAPLMAFWETAFTNAGLTARAFESEAQALAWLAR